MSLVSFLATIAIVVTALAGTATAQPRAPYLPLSMRNSTKFQLRFILETSSQAAYGSSSWADAFTRNSRTVGLDAFEETLIGMISNYTGMNISRRSMRL